MLAEAAIFCCILASLTDFVALDPDSPQIEEPLLKNAVQIRKNYHVSTGYFPESMFRPSRLVWKRKKQTKQLSTLNLYVNHVICVRADAEAVYDMPRGKKYVALMDVSRTRLMGLMFYRQLCPFVIPNTNTKVGGFNPAEVLINGHEARSTAAGRTIDFLVKDYSKVKSLLPLLRNVELMPIMHSPPSTRPSPPRLSRLR